MSATTAPLLTTPLNALHIELGARMVPFAGYSMPVQYPAGLVAEHHHTRNAAGLFDVSHMGQLRLGGADAAAAFETLIPVDVIGLPAGKQRYGLLLTDEGTIIDDLMFVNRGAPSAAGPSQGASAPRGAATHELRGSVGTKRSSSSSMAPARSVTSRISRPGSASAAPSSPCRSGRCWPCRAHWP